MSTRKLLLTLPLLALVAVVVVVLRDGTSGDDPSPSPSQRPSSRALTWAPPKLERPQTLEVSDTKRYFELQPDRDYVIKMPPEPLSGGHGLKIIGGRNVVLIGGEITIDDQGPKADVGSRRGLMLDRQSGTVHVEGLRISGSGLSEGIDIDGRLGPVVQIQNVRIEQIRARDEVNFSDNHPDLIQSWSGPRELRVDRFTGKSDYQGIFLRPYEYKPKVKPERFDLRRVNLNSSPPARHLLWLEEDIPLSVSDVWVVPGEDTDLSRTVWPEAHPRWRAVRAEHPPGGDFVRAGEVGVHYESPGYGPDSP